MQRELRACDEISGALCCRPPGPLARRERRAYRVVCKERTTQPAGLRAAARRGAAAGGHLLRCRSSTMSPHRLRRGALHLPARRSRQSVSLISSQALTYRDSEPQPGQEARLGCETSQVNFNAMQSCEPEEAQHFAMPHSSQLKRS